RQRQPIHHPRVPDADRARLAELAKPGAPTAVIKVIKLPNPPLHDAMDRTGVVVCDEADAIARASESRGLSEAEARARLANQSPQAVKAAAADVVIDGSAPIAETRRQVLDAYESLIAQ